MIRCAVRHRPGLGPRIPPPFRAHRRQCLHTKVTFPGASTSDSHWLHDLDDSALQTHALPNDGIDVAVIGGGIAGFSTALHLHRLDPSLKIAVLDARATVAAGATGRNGGLLWANITANVSEDAAKFDSTEARKRFEFDVANVRAIAQFCEETLQKTGFDALLRRNEDAFQTISLVSGGPQNNMEVNTDPETEVRTIRDDIKFLESQEMEIVTSEVDVADVRDATGCSFHSPFISEEHVVSALQDEVSYMVNPARLTLAMALEACTPDSTQPVQFIPNCTIQSVQRPTSNSTDLFKLHTSQGPLRTRKIIYATNAWTSALLPHLPVVPIRNQVLVSTPLRERREWAVSANAGFEYMSQRGEDGRVVVGGMRYLAPGMDVGVCVDAAATGNEKVRRGLEEYMLRVLDEEIVSVERAWSGVMGWTADGDPFVGSLEGIGECAKEEFVVAGFCGRGMSRCFLSGEAVAQLAAGNEVGDTFPTSYLVTKERAQASVEGVGTRHKPPVKYEWLHN
ncbi:FAD dependent oxidoreductase-domain-containing protein [Chytriomyces sp. MP71]|nr:FAD dependent oxidoreductase-domain-containing protein [Chytriomyces sp. MP71]